MIVFLNLKIYHAVKIYKCWTVCEIILVILLLKTTWSTFIADKSPSVFENIEDCDFNH